MLRRRCSFALYCSIEKYLGLLVFRSIHASMHVDTTTSWRLQLGLNVQTYNIPGKWSSPCAGPGTSNHWHVLLESLILCDFNKNTSESSDHLLVLLASSNTYTNMAFTIST